MDRAELDAAYNNSAAVAGSARTVADWRRRSDVQRASATREFARRCSHRLLPLAGHDHFSILEELAAPGGTLTSAVRGLVDGL